MADLIGLVNEISTSVKLAWVGVLAWGAVQFVWYQRARIFSDATEAVSDSGAAVPVRDATARATRGAARSQIAA